MNIVLLRVGIDTGSGGIHSPLFQGGSFEFIPIPDNKKVDKRTYGSIIGRHGRKLIEYFPLSRQYTAANCPVHADPEFDTFTYGDPTTSKASLRNLLPNDLLVFYSGLEGWDFKSEAALYLVGYFEVLKAGKATTFSKNELDDYFAYNFHVRHPEIYRIQEPKLVLVKGSKNSRIFEKARLISVTSQDNLGRPMKILSPEMQKIFGQFSGKGSIQRSNPRWVNSEYVDRAAQFIRSLR